MENRDISSQKKEYQKCSRCGSLETLNLVTLRYDQSTDSGRVLLYCSPCRTTFQSDIVMNVPLENLTPEIFLSLYREGKTESTPDHAVCMVFGFPNQEIIREAERILAELRSNDAST